MKLSFDQRRGIASVLLLLWLSIAANHLFDLGLFRDYDGLVFEGALLVMLACGLRFLPNYAEMQEYRNKRDIERYGRIKDRTWQIYVIYTILALVVFVGSGTGGRILRGDPLERGDWLTTTIVAGLIPLVIVNSLRSLRGVREGDEE